MKFFLKILIPILFCANSLFANNIRLKNVSLVDTIKASKEVNIKFDLSWENSWRDDINWDAAWVTIKIKRADGSWKHIKIQSTGFSIGTNTPNAKVVVPTDRLGAFIYRSQKGSGVMDLKNIKLRWNYGQDSIANIDSAEIRIFATEMVYVPKGNFAFGDAYTQNASLYDRVIPSIFKNFTLADTTKFGSNSPMFTVISDRLSPMLSNFESGSGPGYSFDQEIRAGIYIHGLQGIAINNSGTYKYPDFPTGYKAFYCMKYEVSQGQYTDFLNTIKPVSSQNNMPYQSDLLPITNNSRFSIKKVGTTYTVSRPDRAMDHVDFVHLFSFANWSAMRPMTELEFEKACRGPLAPRPFDKANGQRPPMMGMLNSNMIYNLKLDGPETGTEAPLGVDSTKFLSLYSNPQIEGGDGGTGAYRVGVFATPTSSRISSGASYYGIMGLTDNVAEYVVSLNTERSRSFKDVNGTGENPAGYPDASRWFGQTGGFVSVYQDMIFKNDSVSSRNSGFPAGFRLVRSAPEEN